MSGDQSWDELFRRYLPILTIVARLYLGRTLRRDYDSLDIAQIVALKLWQGLQNGTLEVRSEAEFRSLIKTLTQRAIADVGRKKGLPREEVQFEHANGEETPSQIFVRREALTDFEIARNELNDDDIKILDLESSELSWKEIAGQLHIGESAARMRWSRAVNKIRQALRERGWDIE